MAAILSEKMKVQIEVTFEDVLGFIEKFSAEQKTLLLQRLRMDAFREQWGRLAQKIQSPGFSEQEILDEVKAYRKERHAHP